MVSVSPMKITPFIETESPNQMENTVCSQLTKPSTLDTCNEEEQESETFSNSSVSPSVEIDPKIKVPLRKARRRSCGICAGCRRDDCGQCVHCRGMVKFGGNGKMKKRCKNRDCENMNKIPNSSPNGIDRFFNGVKSTEATPTSMLKDAATPSSTRINKRIFPMDDNENGGKRAKFEVIPEEVIPTPCECSATPSTDVEMRELTKESTPLKTAHVTTFLKPSSPCSKIKNNKTLISPAKTYPSSPRRYSSPRKNQFLKNITKSASPRKSSIQFGIIKKEEIGPIVDHAPFNDLVHVCQGHSLVTDSGTSVLNRIGMRPEPSVDNGSRMESSLETGVGTGMSLGTGTNLGTGTGLGTGHEMQMSLGTGTNIGIEMSLRMGMGQTNSRIHPSHKDELLQQIKITDSEEHVDKIMTRYDIIKKQLDSLQLENEKMIKDQFMNRKLTNLAEPDITCSRVNKRENNTSSTKTKKQRKSRQCPTNDPVELHCTIHIIRNSSKGIKVDTGKYKGCDVSGRGLRSRSPSRRRASFRQAQEKIQADLALGKENKMPRSLSRIKTPPIDKSSSEDDISIISVENKETRPPNQTRLPEEEPLKENQQLEQPKEQFDVLPSCSFGTHLWNDFYRPNNTSDIIGNERSVIQVRDWLLKWKTRSINSNNKEVAIEGGAEKRDKGQDGDGGSDFKASRRRKRVLRSISLDESFNSSICSDDSHDNEVGVALLLCGPGGCGKTATVYTCANELGYKVLEINSTDNRSRQSLSSVLREATQSHHVRVKQAQPPVAMTTKVSATPSTDKKEKKGGLMAFFKPKPKEKVIDEKNSVACDKQVSLETKTVTLLEEVDLICKDEAKGFWAAILEIVSNTKRPLIFTANDPEMELPFRHTKIMFKPPPTEALSLHCQLLSMSHDIHMTKEEADRITDHAHNDLRRLFNNLHFYLLTSPTGKQCDEKSKHEESSKEASHGDVVARKPLLHVSIHQPLSASIIGTTNIHQGTNCLDSSSDHLNLLHYYDPHLSESILPSILPSMKTTPTTNELYSQLDQCAHIASTLSICDVITKSHDCRTMSHDPHTPWWRSHVTNSLIDELQLESGNNDTNEYRGYLEACLLDLVPDSVQHGMKEQDRTYFKTPNNQIIRQSHDCHMTCCEVFDVRTELHRYPLMTECLPFLHVICASEEQRKLAKQSRRFTHYLSNSEVSLDTLHEFFTVCSYRKS